MRNGYCDFPPIRLNFKKTEFPNAADLRKIEKLLGFPILETSRGGSDGGSTYLTEEGKRIIRIFDEFHCEVDSLMMDSFNKFRDKLK